MCEAIRINPHFKGVVVTTSLVAILLLSLFTSSACGQRSPYCNYLDQSQELRCNCQYFYQNRTKDPQVFPSNEFLISAPPEIAAKVKEVAALKLTGCEKLHLTIDLRPLPHPFYR